MGSGEGGGSPIGQGGPQGLDFVRERRLAAVEIAEHGEGGAQLADATHAGLRTCPRPRLRTSANEGGVHARLRRRRRLHDLAHA